MGREYGTAGLVGVGTPQANPTVEEEFRRLLPPEVAFVTARLHSPDPSPRERLVQYLDRLDQYLETFGGLQLDAFCFACTGSAYLAGPDREARVVERCQGQFGYPVLTATEALARRLARLHARRILLVAPYPDWLVAAARDYWAGRGIDVVDTRRVVTRDPEDTHTIYDLGSADALATVRALGTVAADALVISGTGMPTLAALTDARASAGVPVLTSNLALGQEVLALLGISLSSTPPWPGHPGVQAPALARWEGEGGAVRPPATNPS